jgi:hypothetical protein
MSALAEIAAVDAKLDIRPITPRIGAEIHGVWLSGQLPDSTIRLVREVTARRNEWCAASRLLVLCLSVSMAGTVLPDKISQLPQRTDTCR